ERHRVADEVVAAPGHTVELGRVLGQVEVDVRAFDLAPAAAGYRMTADIRHLPGARIGGRRDRDEAQRCDHQDSGHPGSNSKKQSAPGPRQIAGLRGVWSKSAPQRSACTPPVYDVAMTRSRRETLPLFRADAPRGRLTDAV